MPTINTSVGSTATVSLTTAFIDLSTFDEIECWLYGGKSINRFRKVIRKSAWFTVIAAQLNRCGTNGDFNHEMQAMFSRAGDYIRDVWLRVELPEIRCKAPYQARWTRNIGHNLIDECFLQFNDLTVNKLTSHHLDFLAAFLVPEGKVNGYKNMIGDVPILVDPYDEYAGYEGAIDATHTMPLPAFALNIPLPFWFTRDCHDSIIQAACPFNDVRLTIKFRAFSDLIIIDRLQTPDLENGIPPVVPAVSVDLSVALENPNVRLGTTQVWAHYAVIPNGDREKIGEESDIDCLIEQIQTIPTTEWRPSTQKQRGIDLRFAHSIRALFFAMRNITIPQEWSNYSTHVPRAALTNTPGLIFRPVGSGNPIERAILTYENVDRVNMPADYYTLVAPYYSAERIPQETGYHLLSYANRLGVLQPDGSTNYARLASVNLSIEASDVAVAQATPPVQMDPATPEWDPSFRTLWGNFAIVVTASSLSVLRFSAGSAGFPVL